MRTFVDLHEGLNYLSLNFLYFHSLGGGVHLLDNCMHCVNNMYHISVLKRNPSFSLLKIQEFSSSGMKRCRMLYRYCKAPMRDICDFGLDLI